MKRSNHMLKKTNYSPCYISRMRRVACVALRKTGRQRSLRQEKKKKPFRLFSKEGQRERASLSTQDSAPAPLTWRPVTVSLGFRCILFKPKAPAYKKYSCTSPSLNISTSTFPSRFAQTLTADILHFAAAVRRLAARHKANCSTVARRVWASVWLEQREGRATGRRIGGSGAEKSFSDGVAPSMMEDIRSLVN